jgi:hypothetical protein
VSRCDRVYVWPLTGMALRYFLSFVSLFIEVYDIIKFA